MIGYANVMDSFEITSNSIHRTDKKKQQTFTERRKASCQQEQWTRIR